MSGLELPIISALGILFSGGSQIAGGAARRAASEADAAAKNRQADELLAREGINEQLMLDQSFQAEQNYGSAFAMTGKEGGGIGGMLTIHKNTLASIANARRDAEFKASMLRAGAEVDTKLASDLQTAGVISGAGTIISGAADLGWKYSQYGKKQSSNGSLW